MKKLFISLFMAASALLVNAQTVIRSDYSTPTSNEEISEEKYYEKKYITSVNHYLDFGKFNLSVRGLFLNPNSFGFEFGWIGVDAGEVDDIDFSSQMFDIGANYTYLLSKGENTSLYLTLGLGPSLGFYTATAFDKKELESKSKTKTYIDGYFNPNLVFMYKKFYLSLGYYYRAPQFKFSKKDGADGYLALGIGWDI